MSAVPGPLGMNGPCAAPRKPGIASFPAKPTSGGTPSCAEPCNFDTTAPSDGQPPGGCCFKRLRPVMQWKELWSSTCPTSERMMANLSIIAASRGMCSQIWMPGTFVLIGRNEPRMSDGADIFKSYMS